MENNKEKLSATDYAGALNVQDACNLSGVVFSFARVMQKICDEGLDTSGKNGHSIAVMFSDKIRDLTQSDDLSVFSKAYSDCQNRKA